MENLGVARDSGRLYAFTNESLRLPINAPNGEVHLCQPPSRLIALLPVDGNIVDAALMLRDKLLRLDKHAARPTAGIEHPAFIGGSSMATNNSTMLRGV